VYWGPYPLLCRTFIACSISAHTQEGAYIASNKCPAWKRVWPHALMGMALVKKAHG